MRMRLHACSAPSALITSTSVRRHRDSRAPCLHASTPPRRYTYSAPPELHIPIPPHLHGRIAPRALNTSIPLRLYACSEPLTSTSARHSAPLNLRTFTSLHLQRASIPLSFSTPLRL